MQQEEASCSILVLIPEILERHGRLREVVGGRTRRSGN